MSRPAQLERQIAHVKELQAELANPTPPQDDTSADASVGQVTPPEPPVQPVVVESPVTVSKEEYDRLEQRYRTLQGMHNADVTRLRGEQAADRAAIQALENRLIAAEKSAAPSAPVKYITDKDEEDYGDTLDMVRRAAREEAENTLRTREEVYLNRIAELENQVGSFRNTVVPAVEDMTRAQVDQVKANFWGTINTQVPNWRTINDNMDFKAWLLAEDPITGANRQQFLDQARNDYDAPRVIRFFKEWERAAGGQTPAPKNTAQTELERYVAPGNSRTSAPVDKAKKQWTGADISQFYKDAMLGKYADKPEERKKIEADIFLAQKENRVS